MGSERPSLPDATRPTWPGLRNHPGGIGCLRSYIRPPYTAMPRELPPLSHLQFLALGVILSSDEPGRVIRDVVADFGVRRTGAAFYQLMSRLERDGLIEGWYEPVIVGDQAVRERRYRITVAGARAWRQTRSFYETVATAAAQGRLSNA